MVYGFVGNIESGDFPYFIVKLGWRNATFV